MTHQGVGTIGSGGVSMRDVTSGGSATVDALDLAIAAHRRQVKIAAPHCLHNSVVKKPRGVVLATERAMQLVC